MVNSFLPYLCKRISKPKLNQTDTFDIKRETIKSNKWWKSDKTESMEQTIIRQVENMFTKNNIKF